MNAFVSLGISVGFTVVVFILYARFLASMYRQRFEELTKTVKELILERDKNIKDAFDERDARFARLQGIMSQTIIRDTTLFDSMLEDTESFTPEEDGIDGNSP